MKLNITERLLLGSVFLPDTGGFIEMISIQGIMDKVIFTQKEIQEFELKDAENGGVQWNIEEEKEVEFSFTDNEKMILKKAFEKHDTDNTISRNMTSLCKKISELR